MFVDDDYDGERREDDSGLPSDGHCPPEKRCKPHGTSMLDMVAGAKLGIAKKVKPVLVRVPRIKPQGGGASPEHYLEAVAMADSAFTGDSGETRAILSLSWVYSSDIFMVGEFLTRPIFELWKLRLYKILKSLVRKGVFVVTGSGNNAEVCSSCLVLEVYTNTQI